MARAMGERREGPDHDSAAGAAAGVNGFMGQFDSSPGAVFFESLRLLASCRAAAGPHARFLRHQD